MAPATQTPPDAAQRTLDVYLGFEIRQNDGTGYFAFPAGWSHPDATLLEAPDLPSIRTRIWSWWHRLLD